MGLVAAGHECANVGTSLCRQVRGPPFFCVCAHVRGVSSKGQAGAAASKSASLPQLLAAKTAQFKHAKDLVRCPGMEDGTWTFDEFSKLVSEHAVG